MRLETRSKSWVSGATGYGSGVITLMNLRRSFSVIPLLLIAASSALAQFTTSQKSEVLDEMEPVALVGEPRLVDADAEVGVAALERRQDPIEGRLEQRALALVEAPGEVTPGHDVPAADLRAAIDEANSA